MKQADHCSWISFTILDFVLNLYYYTVAFDREAEDCDREEACPVEALLLYGMYRKNKV